MTTASRSASFFALLACALLAGCSSTHWVGHGDTNTTLAQITEAGVETRYELLAGQRGEAPKMVVTRKRTVPQAYFGVRVEDIDKRLAKQTGVKAWQGVWIQNVISNTAASAAGLRKGDILRRVGSQDIVSQGQFIEHIQSHVAPGDAVPVTIDRWVEEGGATRLQRMELTVVAESRDVLETESDTIELEHSPASLNLSGLQVAQIPAEHAAVIWPGVGGSPTVVSGVMTGSPAYLAGLRGGDRVVAVDGNAAAGLAVIDDAVAARALAHGLTARLPHGTPAQLTAVDGPVEIQVQSNRLGSHRADLTLRDDLRSSTDLDIPILFDFDSDLDSTHWEFLDFIFQFGATYDGRYVKSATREPAHETELSLFPLGMFEFETSPQRDEYTLFWLINFDVENG